MKAILFLLGFLLAAQAQDYRVRDSKNAKILQEARYLQGGTHGAAYLQDDGTEFKEETDADGTRKGSYSYIDDTGNKITVQYTAGKMGFLVSGDHLPKAPAPQAPLPASPAQYQPQQYNPPPQYNSISPNPGQFAYSSQGPQQQFDANFQQYRTNDLTNNNRFGDQTLRNNYPGQFQSQVPQFTAPTEPPQYSPPGKLNLNRTPDGFQYSFSSN